MAQAVGYVEDANASTGSILVNVGPTLMNLSDGVNGTSFAIGDGTGAGAKTVLFKNANTGTLSWTPTAARTLTLPDVTDTLATVTDVAAKQARFMTGTVATAAGTAAKTVTLDAPWAAVTPAAGDFVLLTYTSGTNVGTATVAINGGAARNVRIGNASAVSSVHSTAAGGTLAYYFDGTYLHVLGAQINIDVSSAITNNTLAQRDSNANLTARSLIPGSATVVSAAGNTVLTIATYPVTVVTGTTTQTVTAPTTSITAGYSITVINLSTGAVTVNASGGTTIAVLAGGQSLVAMANQATPTLNTHWAITGGAARVTPRIGTTTSTATPSIDCSLYDQYNITALAADITSVTVTGTPTDGQKLLVRITGTATRAVTWGSSFQSSGTATLLAATSGTNTHLVGFIYDGVKTKWIAMAGRTDLMCDWLDGLDADMIGDAILAYEIAEDERLDL